MDHLTDAPVANILILAGIVFLAVGLFGRIGGFIGSIFGNIEAGNSSRVLAGALGVVLIVFGVRLHESGDRKNASNSPVTTVAAGASPTVAAPQPSQVPVATPAAAPPAAPTAKPQAKKKALESGPSPAQPAAATKVPDSLFVGKWMNESLGTNRIHWFQIDRDGLHFTIHLWGACSPTADCDGGVHSLDVNGQTASYSRTVENENRIGKLTLQAPGRLHLTLNRFNLSSHATVQIDWGFVRTN